MPQIPSQHDPEIVRYENGFQDDPFIAFQEHDYYYHLFAWGIFRIQDAQTHITIRNARLPGEILVGPPPPGMKDLNIEVCSEAHGDMLEEAGTELEKGLTDKVILAARLALLNTLKGKSFPRVALAKKYYFYPLFYILTEGVFKNLSWLLFSTLVLSQFHVDLPAARYYGMTGVLALVALVSARWTAPNYFHHALIGNAPSEIQLYGTDPLIRDPIAITRKLNEIKKKDALAQIESSEKAPRSPIEKGKYKRKRSQPYLKKMSRYSSHVQRVFLATFFVPELGDACALAWYMGASYFSFEENNRVFWVFMGLYALLKAFINAKSVSMAGVDAEVGKKFFMKKTVFPPAFLYSKIFSFAHEKTLKISRMIFPVLEVSSFAFVVWKSAFLNRLLSVVVEPEAATAIKIIFILLSSMTISLKNNLFDIKKMQADVRTDLAAEPFRSKTMNKMAWMVGGNYFPISHKAVRGTLLGMFYVATAFYLFEWRLNFFLSSVVLPRVGNDSWLTQKLGPFFAFELASLGIALGAAIPAMLNAMDAFYRFGKNERRDWKWCGCGVLEKEELAAVVVENPRHIENMRRAGNKQDEEKKALELRLAVPQAKGVPDVRSPDDGSGSKGSTASRRRLGGRRARVRTMQETKPRPPWDLTPETDDSPRSHVESVVSHLNQSGNIADSNAADFYGETREETITFQRR